MLTPRLRRTAVVAVASVSMLAAAPAAAPAKKQDLEVLLRNVYLGADLIPLAAAQSRDEFERNAAERYATVLRNDFAMRAKGLAIEVRRSKPDIIALQEAAVWRRGPDGLKDGRQTPANQLVYDSTRLLISEMRKRGMTYRVVRGRDWFDFEAPLGDPFNFDARLIQRDVILRRATSKVRIRRTFKGKFASQLNVPTQAGLAEQKRGWVGIDGRLAGRNFRLITTHLEAYSPQIAEQQMNELLSGPANRRKHKTILMGDFNSAPEEGGTDDRQAQREPSAYRAAMDAGFRNPFPRRATCCFAEDLRRTDEPLDSWIDHIVVRPRMRLLRSEIVGHSPEYRIGGLWPSDHAGISGTIRLPK